MVRGISIIIAIGFHVCTNVLAMQDSPSASDTKSTIVWNTQPKGPRTRSKSRSPKPFETPSKLHIKKNILLDHATPSEPELEFSNSLNTTQTLLRSHILIPGTFDQTAQFNAGIITEKGIEISLDAPNAITGTSYRTFLEHENGIFLSVVWHKDIESTQLVYDVYDITALPENKWKTILINPNILYYLAAPEETQFVLIENQTIVDTALKAVHGYHEAQNWFGLHSIRDEKAIKWFHAAIKNGSSQARTNLGYYYEARGFLKRAAQEYQTAIAQGSALAAYQLAHMHAQRGWMHDFFIARSLYHIALDRCEFIHPLMDLAKLYEHGLGGPVELCTAQQYYQRAHELGSPEARKALLALYRKRYNSATQKGAYQVAKRYLEHAIKLDDPDSCIELGFYNLLGTECKKNPTRAKSLWQKAQELGSARATQLLHDYRHMLPT